MASLQKRFENIKTSIIQHSFWWNSSAAKYVKLFSDTDINRFAKANGLNHTAGKQAKSDL